MSIESGEVHDWPPVTSAHASRGQPDATRSLAVRPVASIQSAPPFLIVPTPWPTHVATSPSLPMMMPWPSPYRVPSGRTLAEYVPVSVSSTPSSLPLAAKDDSIFGPPLGFGSTL